MGMPHVCLESLPRLSYLTINTGRHYVLQIGWSEPNFQAEAGLGLRWWTSLLLDERPLSMRTKGTNEQLIYCPQWWSLFFFPFNFSCENVSDLSINQFHITWRKLWLDLVRKKGKKGLAWWWYRFVCHKRVNFMLVIPLSRSFKTSASYDL